MKKHLLFILTAYPNLGGIETVTNILSQELIKRYGCEIDIVTFNYKKEYENLIPNEVRVHELSNRGGGINHLKIRSLSKG